MRLALVIVLAAAAIAPAELARACERRDKDRAEARAKLEREMDDAFAKAKAETDAHYLTSVGASMRLMVECVDTRPPDAGPMTILADNHGKLMQCWPETR